ncbi:conserved hypothetical protein [Clostridium botulinum C str. Eklund]|nr:conserved hypothetical protein [Clostridium botulinum C str. Eklund]
MKKRKIIACVAAITMIASIFMGSKDKNKKAEINKEETN